MTAAVVVDSSVALKWFLREPDADKADAIVAAGTEMLAPDFLLLEVANGLRRQQRAGIIDATTVIDAVSGLAGIFTELLVTETLIVEALQISQGLDHSIYDCLFLAAGRRRGVPLITADATFAAKLEATPYASNVVLLGDWKA
jgi:predicted nucleic acid-binding protein